MNQQKWTKKNCLKVTDNRRDGSSSSSSSSCTKKKNNWTAQKYFRFTTKSFISECEFMALLLLFSSCLSFFFPAGGDIVVGAASQCIRIIHFAMIVAKTTYIHKCTPNSFVSYNVHTHTHTYDVATMRKIAAKLLKNSTWSEKECANRTNREEKMKWN